MCTCASVVCGGVCRHLYKADVHLFCSVFCCVYVCICVCVCLLCMCRRDIYRAAVCMCGYL
jgi:hypothetical protein